MGLWPVLLFWSDNLQLYRWVYWGGMALLAALVWWPSGAGEKAGALLGRVLPHPLLFAGVLVAWVVLSRWPGFFYHSGYNVDEDQHLAALLALLRDPVFYRAADTVTSGPLNSYLLLWPALLGLEPTLFTMRLTGVAAVAAGIALLYAGARAFWGERAARTGALYPAVFFASTTFWDFVHQTTEMLSVAFWCAAAGGILWLAARPGGGTGLKISVAWAAGLLLACMPWAKLQGAFLGLLTGALLLVVLWFRRRSPAEFLLAAGAAAGGASCLTAGLLVFFHFHEVLSYFWHGYILNSLAYRSKDAGFWTWHGLLGHILLSGGPRNRPMDYWMALLSFLLFSLAATAGLVRAMKSRQGPEDARPPRWAALGGATLLLVAAFWTVQAPSRPFSHYLLYTVAPMGVWLTALAGLIPETFFRRNRFLTPVLLLCCLVPMGTWRVLEPNLAPKRGPRWRERPLDAVSRAIVEAAGPGDQRLTVWGYNPVYHTRTRLAPATRLSSAEGIFFQSPDLREFYLRTYLADLQKNRPAVFVDAAAPGQGVHMNDPAKHSHERVPEIADWVQQNYLLADEIDGVRVFRLREKAGP